MERKTEEPVQPVKYTYTVPVKFEEAGKPYSFGTEDSSILKGDLVVVETQQGLEMGKAEGDALEVGKYNLRMPQRPVIRKATDRDKETYQRNLKENDIAFDICRSEI